MTGPDITTITGDLLRWSCDRCGNSRTSTTLDSALTLWRGHRRWCAIARHRHAIAATIGTAVFLACLVILAARL